MSLKNTSENFEKVWHVRIRKSLIFIDPTDIWAHSKKYIAKEAIRTLITLDEEMLLSIRLSKQKKRRHIYQFWQPDYYDFNILTESKLNEKLKYMYENPLRKGLCNNISDYEFSNFKRYFGSGDPELPLVCNDSIE
jgi:hypothetical protein